MKKIILTVTTDLSYDQRMRRICGTLARDGYDICLIGRKRPNSVPLIDRPYRQVRFRNLFDRGKLFYLEHNVRLFFHLLTHRFDVVCGADLDTILPCYLAAKIKGKPCVYDAHEIFTEIPELTGRPLVKKTWLRLESYVVPRIPFAYTVNESLVDIFRERYGASFQVIRNISRLRLPVGNSRESGYLFYQGVLNKGRGLEALIQAMKTIDGKLLLAGEGDLSGELRELVKSLDLEEKVVFLGFMKPEDLVPLMEGAAVATNLRAATALNDYYSLANKFFDYVHAGVPQITMRFPEYERVNKKYEVAILLDDLSVDGVRQAVLDLFTRKDLHERLKENCMRAREVYNWEREEPKLLDFYRSVFEQAGPGPEDNRKK